MKSIPNNPASTCSPFARNGGIQPSAAAERQNAAQTPPSEAVPVGLRSSGRPKAGRTSITKRVKTALATALLTGLTTVLYAAPPTITARVEPDSIGIGDRFDVVIDVDRDLVQVVEFPTFNPPPQSGLEVVESHPVDTLRRDGRHLSLRKRYTLAAFEEGNLGLGRAQVLYLDKNITDTLYTADTLRLQVGTFQIDSTSHTIYDIKAQRTLPFRYGEISGYVLWSLLGLIVLGGAIYAGRRLMATGIKANDCVYVDLYNDYLQMRDTGNKMTYIVAMLSDKYNVSERQVYSIIDRLGKDCKSCAV